VRPARVRTVCRLEGFESGYVSRSAEFVRLLSAGGVQQFDSVWYENVQYVNKYLYLQYYVMILFSVALLPIAEM